MIDPRDIQDLAVAISLAPNVVEKDYVLGWLLAGIGNDGALGSGWVFKGGTCLKKVHFETYRFSEDLDFTVRDPESLKEELLLERFASVSKWIYEQSGVVILQDQSRFDVYRNPRGNLSVEGRVYYRGPLRGPRNAPKIKLDLTSDEVLVLEPERRRVNHPYDDDPAEGIHVTCYAYAEIFAEKTRALQERGRPRDLYDVVNLFRREDTRGLLAEVRAVLVEKCKFKGIAPPTLASISVYKVELEKLWGQMLSHQLPMLPPFESFWRELPAFFDWLEGKTTPVERRAFPLATGDEVIRAPLGGLGWIGRSSRALESIRFAATNHLVVELEYVDESGVRARRLIEPYSLRRTRAGEVLLHAERADGSGHRSYRVDRIIDARASDQSFVPKDVIELAPGGFGEVRIATGALRSTSRRTVRSTGKPTGPRYVYECTRCQRRFVKRKRDSTLRPHQNKAGGKCLGRVGVYRETRLS